MMTIKRSIVLFVGGGLSITFNSDRNLQGLLRRFFVALRGMVETSLSPCRRSPSMRFTWPQHDLHPRFAIMRRDSYTRDHVDAL